MAYLNNTRDPENYRTLHQFLVNNVFEDIDHIMKIQTDKMEIANNEMQQRIISDGDRINQLTQMVSQEREKTKEKEEQLREKNQSLRMGLETEMQSMQNEIRNKEEQFKNLEKLVQKGWESNEKLVREIKTKELDTIKTKLAAEYDKKAYEQEREYKSKLTANKKEIKKIFEVTMVNMKNTYDDEIKILKK
jgi:chromosome segregation ATPase